MKKIFLMLVAALMVGTATVNAQIWGGQLILRGVLPLTISRGTIREESTCCRGIISALILIRTSIKEHIGIQA